jgi:hypothetical protein
MAPVRIRPKYRHMSNWAHNEQSGTGASQGALDLTNKRDSVHYLTLRGSET